MYNRDIETNREASLEYNRRQKAAAAERWKQVKSKMAHGKKSTGV